MSGTPLKVLGWGLIVHYFCWGLEIESAPKYPGKMLGFTVRLNEEFKIWDWCSSKVLVSHNPSGYWEGASPFAQNWLSSNL